MPRDLETPAGRNSLLRAQPWISRAAQCMQVSCNRKPNNYYALE